MVTVTLPSDGDSQVDVTLPRATGTSATIAIGTVTTGPTTSVTNVGTATAAVFDFVFPTGGGGGVSPPFAISDTTGLQAALNAKAPLASPTFTGTVSGITSSMVGLGNVTNTSDAAKPVSTAQQAALDLKAPLASPTFTGTVSGITKAMVGLGSVDNTADTAKPVSTAQQTALNQKADLASPALTGTPTAPTAANGTNTTQVATTAFVLANAGGGGTAPLGNFTATVPPTPNDDSADGYGVGSRWLNTTTSQMWTARSVGVGAAVWVLEDLADHPGYVSGNWYHGNTGISVAAGTAMAADTIRLIPFVFKTRITIDAIGIRITTASASTSIQAAIYANNPATGRPTGVAMAATNSLSTGTAGGQSVLVAAGATTFEAGIYWFATNTSSSTVVCQAYVNSQVVMGYMIGSPTLTEITSASTTATLSLSVSGQTFGTWPDLTAVTPTRVMTASYAIPLFRAA